MSAVPNVKAVIEYDGTDFHGFQRQPKLRTVQGELERAIGSLFQESNWKLIGAGRTDAGVHATGQVINFAAPEWFPIEKLGLALNSALPPDVRVRSAQEASDDFHARYSAKWRRYMYVVLNQEMPSALLARYAWYVRQPLDIQAMKAATVEIIGERDFASFGMPDREGGSTVREVFDIRIGRRKNAVIFRITANAFLRGMARAIVGAMVDVGRGRLHPEDVGKILEEHNRNAVRVTALPRGLYLTRVEY
jgi:tRNA pseudouridine38-40 synthase